METKLPKDLCFGGSSPPPGIFVFTAAPKLLSPKKCQRSQRYSAILKKTHRRPVSSKDIDVINGLFENLGVGRNKSEISKDAPETSVATENDETLNTGDTDRPVISSLKLRNRIVRQARRKLMAEPMQVAPSWLFNRILKKEELNYNQGKSHTIQRSKGLYRIPFIPVNSAENEFCYKQQRIITARTKHQCICAMPYYEHKSMEEIRFEDYLTGRKGPTTNLHHGPTFGAPTGTDTMMRSGAAIPISTEHQCINAMPEYEHSSFEELRVEHYMPSTGWKDREKYSLTPTELQILPIAINSKVFIFQGNERVEGRVRFIGTLPDKPSTEIHVGIDLCTPVGDGDGCYKKLRLFRTKQLHAKFVPLDSALPGYLFDDGEQQSAQREETEYKWPIAETSSPSTSTQETNSNSKETANACSVCWMNPVSMFFAPCGHVCCCERCSKKLRDCPICRKPIRQKFKAYLT